MRTCQPTFSLVTNQRCVELMNDCFQLILHLCLWSTCVKKGYGHLFVQPPPGAVVQPLPGAVARASPRASAKEACAFMPALTWALEAEKLDLPHLSAHCERFIAMHWEHLHQHSSLIADLSSPARHRITMGTFHALQSLQ